MALPSSPPISLSQIKTELGLTGNMSLVDCLNASNLADKTLPVAMTRFLGYTHTTCSAAPNAVIGADASVVSNDVTITWTPDSLGEDPSQFRIERNPQSTGIWEFVANRAAGGDNTYFDNDVPPDQYLYRVRAENACGNSVYRDTNSVIVP
jgi:hypothetical protein